MNVIRCKIALVGDTHVGKTSIVNQLVKNDFNTTYQTTLGIDYNQYDVKIKDTNYVVQFHILDFTGFSIFREMLNNQIKDVNFILYVYDSTNLESFQNIKLWKKSINDLIPEKIVTDKLSVDSFANNFKLKSWNVSARMKTNLNELFEEMGKIYYDHYINFINKIKNLN